MLVYNFKNTVSQNLRARVYTQNNALCMTAFLHGNVFFYNAAKIHIFF